MRNQGGGGNLKDIDLIMGGSPCQGFSIAGKMLNFNDPRSKLFFEFVRLVKEIKPKYFLLENVKMKKERIDIISSELGVQPIEINSGLVSAQNRRRLYRTNIPNISQPKDKGILLKDILEANVDERYNITEKQRELIEFQEPSHTGEAKRIGGMYGQVTRRGIYDIEGKSPTTTASMGMGGGHIPTTACGEVRIKQATKKGYIVAEEGDGISFSFPHSTTRRGRVTKGKANTLTCNGDSYVYEPRIAYAPSSREFRQQGRKTDKAPTICARDYKDPKIVDNGILIRKLTPTECERLQTLPDNYTAGVSDSQRYKALGNGRTVDVIAHIFSFIPSES